MKDAPVDRIWQTTVEKIAKSHALESLAQAQRPPIENLVFEGGGVKGAVYAGALDVMERENLLKDVKRVAGSSAGGIVSLLLAIGYTPSEIKAIMTEEIDFKSLMDRRAKWDPTRLKEVNGIKVGVSDLVSLFKHKGAFMGKAFEKLAEKMIKDKFEQKIITALLLNPENERDLRDIEKLTGKPFRENMELYFKDPRYNKILHDQFKNKIEIIKDEFGITEFSKITFKQFQAMRDMSQGHKQFLGLGNYDFGFKELFLTGTNLSDVSLKVFSHNSDPNMTLVDALRITMSFPMGFEPVLYQGHYYADGGIADNYPMGIFDKPEYLEHGRNDAGVNPCTLGFLVDSEEEIEARWGVSKNHAKQHKVEEQLLTALMKNPKFHKQRNKIEQKMGGLAFIKSTQDQFFKNEAVFQFMREQFAVQLEKIKEQSHVVNLNKMNNDDIINLEKFLKTRSAKLLGLHKVKIKKEDIGLFGLLASVVSGMHNRSEILKELYSINSIQIFDEKVSTLDFNMSDEKKAKLVASGAQAMTDYVENYIKGRVNYANLPDFNTLKEKYYSKGEAELTRIIEKELFANILNLNKLHEVIDALQLEKAIDELEASGEDEQLLNTLINLLSAKNHLKKLTESLHEHLDVCLEAMMLYNKDYKDPRIPQMVVNHEPHETTLPLASHSTIREQDKQVEKQYSHSLRDLVYRLGVGKWGDNILLETRENVAHNVRNHAYEKDSEGLTKGKHVSQFSVDTFSKKNKAKVKFLSFKYSYKKAPINAKILTPDAAALKNFDKPIKDIIVAFQEPIRESLDHNEKRYNYSLAIKNANSRENYFNQCKEELLKRVKFAMQNAKANGLLPPDAKFRLTVFGEGLAGLDAQLLMASVIDELANDKLGMFSKLKPFIDSVELNLVDPIKVDRHIAQATANNLLTLKEDSSTSIKFQERVVQNYSTIAGTKKKIRSQNYLGEMNVFGLANRDCVDIKLQLQDKRNKKLTFYSDNANQQRNDALKKRLNRRHEWYNSSIYTRLLNPGVNLGLAASNYTRKKLKNIGKTIFKIGMSPLKIIESVQSVIKNIDGLIHEAKKEQVVHEEINWKVKYNQLKQKVVNFEEQPNYGKDTGKLIANNLETSRLAREGRPPIENLVFEGGGVKGTVYAGALEVLGQTQSADGRGKSVLDEVKRVAGSSAGGITASLLAVGYEPKEIMDILNNQIDFKKLMDTPYKFDLTLIDAKGMKIGPAAIHSLFKNKGLYKGDAFKVLLEALYKDKIAAKLKEVFLTKLDEGIIQQLSNQELETLLDEKLAATISMAGIKDLGKITFDQLNKLNKIYPSLNMKELYVTGTKVSDGSLKVFSGDSADTKDMSIVDAVRITMSFPGGFMPVEYKRELYVDGGVADNYPMRIFDQEKFLTHGRNDANVNPCTLGFLVDSQEEIDNRWGKGLPISEKIKLPTLIAKTLEGMHNRAEILRDLYNINSIQIHDLGVETMDMNMTDATKQALVQSGRDATQFYVDNYMNTGVGGKLAYGTGTDYVNFEQKYFSKNKQYIRHIIKNDIIPNINRLKHALKDVHLAGEDSELYEEQIHRCLAALRKELAVAQRALALKGENVHQIGDFRPNQMLFTNQEGKYKSILLTNFKKLKTLAHESLNKNQEQSTWVLEDAPSMSEQAKVKIRDTKGNLTPIQVASSIPQETADGRQCIHHAFTMRSSVSTLNETKSQNSIEAMAKMVIDIASQKNKDSIVVRANGKEMVAVELAAAIMRLQGDKQFDIKFKAGEFSDEQHENIINQARQLNNVKHAARMNG